jgi:hypothetical protein
MLILLVALLVLAPAAVPTTLAQERAAQAPVEKPTVKPKAEKGREALKAEATEITRRAGQKVTEFARYADSLFEDATGSALIGWGLFCVAVLVGLVAMFYGWTILQSFLIPFAPFWGLLTGGGIAFCLITAFYTGRATWFKLLLLAVGIALGFGLYLFSALRAKPVAAFLVIMSPFLLLAAFLFPIQDALGLAIFVAGFVAGFAAMIEVRPLAIISTSLFGAVTLLASLGLLSHLLGARAEWLEGFYRWVMGGPLLLVVSIAVLAFIGGNYQFMTGPRGSLED